MKQILSIFTMLICLFSLNAQERGGTYPAVGTDSYNAALELAVGAANAINSRSVTPTVGYDLTTIVGAERSDIVDNSNTRKSGFWAATENGTPIFDIGGSPVVYCGNYNMFMGVKDDAGADAAFFGNTPTLSFASAAGVSGSRTSAPKLPTANQATKDNIQSAGHDKAVIVSCTISCPDKTKTPLLKKSKAGTTKASKPAKVTPAKGKVADPANK